MSLLGKSLELCLDMQRQWLGLWTTAFDHTSQLLHTALVKGEAQPAPGVEAKPVITFIDGGRIESLPGCYRVLLQVPQGLTLGQIELIQDSGQLQIRVTPVPGGPGDTWTIMHWQNHDWMRCLPLPANLAGDPLLRLDGDELTITW